MLVDSGGLSKQPVQRNDGGDRGKEREKSIEYDARCYRKEPILVELRIGAPQNIFPSRPCNTPRRSCLPSTAWLASPLTLNVLRFIGAAGRAKGACRRPTGIARRPRTHPRRRATILPMPMERRDDSSDRAKTKECPDRAAMRCGRRCHWDRAVTRKRTFRRRRNLAPARTGGV